MNKVILMGRLTKDPAASEKMTRFKLAVDRRFSKGETDFIDCKAFGKTKEFVDRYLKQGTKVCIEGRIQTGSYEKNGQTIYTTDVIAEAVEFCESKKSEEGFIKVETDEGMPFDV